MQALPETTQGKINLGETSNQSMNPEDGRAEKKLGEVPAQGTGILANKKIVIAIVVGVLVLAGLIIGLAVGLTRKKQSTTSDAEPTPSPPFCESNPLACANVPDSAMSYIMSTYTSTNQMKAMLKLSQAFTTIGASTIEEKRNAFHSVLMATECLERILPNGHTAAYQGLINAQFTATDI